MRGELVKITRARVKAHYGFCGNDGTDGSVEFNRKLYADLTTRSGFAYLVSFSTTASAQLT